MVRVSYNHTIYNVDPKYMPALIDSVNHAYVYRTKSTRVVDGIMKTCGVETRTLGLVDYDIPGKMDTICVGNVALYFHQPEVSIMRTIQAIHWLAQTNASDIPCETVELHYMAFESMLKNVDNWCIEVDDFGGAKFNDVTCELDDLVTKYNRHKTNVNVYDRNSVKTFTIWCADEEYNYLQDEIDTAAFGKWKPSEVALRILGKTVEDCEWGSKSCFDVNIYQSTTYRAPDDHVVTFVRPCVTFPGIGSVTPKKGSSRKTVDVVNSMIHRFEPISAEERARVNKCVRDALCEVEWCDPKRSETMTVDNPDWIEIAKDVLPEPPLSVSSDYSESSDESDGSDTEPVEYSDSSDSSDDDSMSDSEVYLVSTGNDSNDSNVSDGSDGSDEKDVSVQGGKGTLGTVDVTDIRKRRSVMVDSPPKSCFTRLLKAFQFDVEGEIPVL